MLVAPIFIIAAIILFLWTQKNFSEQTPFTDQPEETPEEALGQEIRQLLEGLRGDHSDKKR